MKSYMHPVTSALTPSTRPPFQVCHALNCDACQHIYQQETEMAELFQVLLSKVFEGSSTVSQHSSYLYHCLLPVISNS